MNSIQTQNQHQINIFPPASSELSIVDYAILRTGVKHYCNYQFQIFTPIVKKYFKHYFLLYWKGDYLLDQIQAGRIIKDGITYKVVYGRGNSRGAILAHRNNQFALSFRVPVEYLNLVPTVIIYTKNNNEVKEEIND